MTDVRPYFNWALLNQRMNFDVLKFLTPYSLCVSAPLREINHPAIMQRL